MSAGQHRKPRERPRLIRAMWTRIEQLLDDLLDDDQEQEQPDRLDRLAAEFARRIPATLPPLPGPDQLWRPRITAGRIALSRPSDSHPYPAVAA